MPSRVIDTTPRTMKLRMTIVAKTGRLIEVSEIHMAMLASRVGNAVCGEALAGAASATSGIARTFV